MDESEFQSRLSQIVTRWTLLQQAHDAENQAAPHAQSELIDRYRGAIYRYLVAILRDPDAADEVCQDFALRFVKGDFHGVDPARGKFRAFLKTVLSRMVIDYHRRTQRAPKTESIDIESLNDKDPSGGSDFEDCWRIELIRLALDGLQTIQEQSGQPYHTVLRFQLDSPSMTAREVADSLNTSLQPQRPFTDVGARKILQRARRRFAELLVKETELSIGYNQIEAIEADLAELGLLQYCQSILDERRA